MIVRVNRSTGLIRGDCGLALWAVGSGFALSRWLTNPRMASLRHGFEQSVEGAALPGLREKLFRRVDDRDTRPNGWRHSGKSPLHSMTAVKT
jgi:hypothetical protein